MLGRQVQLALSHTNHIGAQGATQTLVTIRCAARCGCQTPPPRTYAPLQIGMPETELPTACSPLTRGDITIESNGLKWYWALCFRRNRHYADVRVINGRVESIALKAN